jgi:branched-chain amino acid transport system permease protein
MQTLIITQALNGIQLGVLLFLLAAGLTLVFGIMNFVNLAHGSLYMMGAFFAATAYNLTDSFLAAAAAAVLGMALLGVVMEQLVVRHLAQSDHLDHVLATFGLILFFNEIARMVWGSQPYYMQVPDALAGTVAVLGVDYSAYRLLIIGVGLAVAVGLYVLIHRTRLGMLIRAGASHPQMVSALGVNIARINAVLFALGAVLAGVAGLMAAPILSVQPGMGDTILILTLVVIVIGGIGSVRGSFYAALIVGVVDTLGRSVLPLVLRELFERSTANAAGPAVASMLIYMLMAVVLALRPQGLFPVQRAA